MDPSPSSGADGKVSQSAGLWVHVVWHAVYVSSHLSPATRKQDGGCRMGSKKTKKRVLAVELIIFPSGGRWVWVVSKESID